MQKVDNDDYPRILIISNNSFSVTNNNGKTLASFFDRYPSKKIAQLYFNSEVPTDTYYNNYFRITDSEIVKSVVGNRNDVGEKINAVKTHENHELSKGIHNFINSIKNNNIARIVREFFWKSGKWKTDTLNNWLDEFSPNVIFLCAGDSVFTYDITKYIQKRFDSKLVVYITDDYVLPRKNLSPFWWFRRNIVLGKMEFTVQRSDLFITISKKMKDSYKELFGKESIIAVNMTESLRDESISAEENEMINLVYTGGLHFKRYLTLNSLAKALLKYNENPSNKKKAYIKIYSGQLPDNKIKKYLNLEGASEYCGSLNPMELKAVLNSCDIPIHVESFDKRSIASTRLSISTKISEYLSIGKPVLAIGPKDVASMEYLSDIAFCITNPNEIQDELTQLLNNNELLKSLAKEALKAYEKNHKKDIVSGNLIQEILSLTTKPIVDE